MESGIHHCGAEFVFRGREIKRDVGMLRPRFCRCWLCLHSDKAVHTNAQIGRNRLFFGSNCRAAPFSNFRKKALGEILAASAGRFPTPAHVFYNGLQYARKAPPTHARALRRRCSARPRSPTGASQETDRPGLKIILPHWSGPYPNSAGCFERSLCRKEEG